ncbi:MAG TPA: hypothetical protein GXX14_06095 [Clostridiaceae bacterium]|nr:hypothetical protein [Clostridiaceae bacterium]
MTSIKKKEKFLNELVRGCSYDIETICRKTEYLGLNLETGHVRAILIEIDNFSSDEAQYTEDEKNLLFFAVTNIIQEIMDGKLKGLCFNGYKEIIILCNSQETNEALQKIILDMQDCVKRYLKKTISAGIGRIYESVKQLPKSFSEAKELLSSSSSLKAFEVSQMISYIDVSHFSPAFLKHQRRQCNSGSKQNI